MNSLHSIPSFVLVAPLSLAIIFCYWNSFIFLCCVICIAFFCFVSLSCSHLQPYSIRGQGESIVEQQMKSTQILVQGTFLNSTTRLRVRVPLRKVWAIILVSCIAMGLSRYRTKAWSTRLGFTNFSPAPSQNYSTQAGEKKQILFPFL